MKKLACSLVLGILMSGSAVANAAPSLCHQAFTVVGAEIAINNSDTFYISGINGSRYNDNSHEISFWDTQIAMLYNGTHVPLPAASFAGSTCVGKQVTLKWQSGDVSGMLTGNNLNVSVGHGDVYLNGAVTINNKTYPLKGIRLVVLG